MTKRRLMFYTTSLSGGGAERVWAVLASALARRGHEVTLVVDFAADENRGFLAPEVDLVVLGAGHVRSLVALMGEMMRRRPDLVFSAIGGSDIKAVVASALIGRFRRVVTSFHGYIENETGLFGWLHFKLARPLTWAAASTVCVSDGLERDVVERWHALPDRCVRIYNPVTVAGTDPSLTREGLAAREPIILGVGRLVPVKGFVELVRAFARMNDRTARLVILGQGPERDTILAEAEALGVADRVLLPGYVAKPWDWYARARCFALSSHVEAFGNVVVEALAHGLPVVATPCDGPREILSDERLGVLASLADDERGYADALDAAIADPGDPVPRMVRSADFEVPIAAARYEALVDRILDPATR